MTGVSKHYGLQRKSESTQTMIDLSVFVISDTRTVVRECCKDDDQSQWEKPKFDPRHP